MMLAKIEGAEGYLKDTETKSVINTDNKSLEEYRIGRAHRNREQEAINNIKKENAELKQLINRVIKFSFNLAELTNEELLEIEQKSKATMNG